jgi:hypothetical protein
MASMAAAAVVAPSAPCASSTATAAPRTRRTAAMPASMTGTVRMISVALGVHLLSSAFGPAFVPILAWRRVDAWGTGGYAWKVAERRRTGRDGDSEHEGGTEFDWHGHNQIVASRL